jgi:hypothetical protein
MEQPLNTNTHQGAAVSTTIPSTIPPGRSSEQRRLALDLANQTRSRRSQLKRDLTGRRVSAADVIADPPDWAATMKVRLLLLATPALGVSKVDRILAASGISAVKTLGGITGRQRDALIAALGDR